MSKEKSKNKNHTSHFAPHTSNKGITLIALIITIIVLLILVGVTLSVTLGDNGLVNKAKEASEATEIAMDRELLLSAVVGTIDNNGEVNLGAIVLPEGFTGSNGTYTSSNGHTFNVGLDGTVTYVGGEESPEVPENSSEDLELLRRYFIGEGEEINVFTLMQNPEVAANGNYSELKFIDNEIIPTISEELIVNDVTVSSIDENSMYGYFQFRNIRYIMTMQGKAENYAIVSNIEIISDLPNFSDFIGKYYNEDGEKYEIKDNTFIYTTKSGKYELEIESYTFHEYKSICTITTKGSFANNEIDLNDSEDIVINYNFIYENGQLINKVLHIEFSSNKLVSIEKRVLVWQNENGIMADIEGTYINETGDRRLVLKPEEKQIDYQYLSDDGERWYFTTQSDEGELYIKVNGAYWAFRKWQPSFVVNENTISYNGQTYTKVNE